MESEVVSREVSKSQGSPSIFGTFLSFYRYWFRSNLSITPGSANLEILINKKKQQKNKTTQKKTKTFG